MRTAFFKASTLLKVSTLLMAAVSSSESHATVTRDIQAKMTSILGHAPSVTSVIDAQAQKLDRSWSKHQPWSGSYWPDINGGIAIHYRTHMELGSKFYFILRYDIAKSRLKSDFNHVLKNVNKWDVEKLNKKLSPSEKYDLLLGDLNFSFTKAVMEEADFRQKYRLTTKRTSGEDAESEGDDNSFYEDDFSTYSKYDDKVQYRYWREKGNSLAYWSGICDGWSPASIYLPRPSTAVTVKGALGHTIVFYPDDLKALGSYLFARTNTPYFTTMNYQFAGRKCDESGDPERGDNGFVKDIRCNDLDAGVFHLALLNRIGKDRMGFVMDFDNNLKINNHPISSYSVSYFSPVNGDEVALKKAITPIENVKDAYGVRRNPKTKYLVGVKTEVTFMYYIFPESNRTDSTDSPDQDKLKTVKYAYDLELDENYNILGGEWGDRSDENGKKAKYADQPDFIWMSAPQSLPYSEMSPYAVAGTPKDPSNPRPFGNMNWAWDGKSALPSDWLSAAIADATWQAPVPGKKLKDSTGIEEVYPYEAKNSVLKSAQPLSHIIYYLFDRSRLTSQQ